MAQHTPGPWHADGPDEIFSDFNIIGPEDCRAIAAVVSNLRPDGQVEANARLISAAPELLAELILARAEVVDTRQCIFESCTIRDDPLTLDEFAKADIDRIDAQLARIDAAIAKATGGAA